MGRSPCCCDEAEVKKGPWNEEEDKKLVEYIQKHGGHVASWRGLPRAAGLNRCGKSCRLRWTNYLRPGIKRGKFADDEERLIIHLHSLLGNKWSTIATHLQGRTDNEIKNYWNTHIRKKLMLMGIDPVTHQRRTSNLDAPAPPSLLAALLSAAAGLGGLDSALLQVQLQQQLVQAICYGTSNGIAPPPPPMANIEAVANAILSSCPILPNYQIANSLSSHADRPGYLCNISNAAEQEMVQQLDTTSVVFSSYAAPTARCSGGSVSAATPQEAAAAARVQDFAGLEPVEALPDLYSVEDDLSWNDILDAISTPHTL